jgi:hypothetical protein
MKRYTLPLLTALLITTAAASQTVYAVPDTITVTTDLFDDMLQQVARGQATARTLDTLRSFYKEAVQRYDSSQNNVIALLNERDAATDYINRLKGSLKAAQDAVTIGEGKYLAMYNKRNKAFGIGASVGYNPFTRLPMAGISLNWNLIRFSLRGLFASDTPAQLPEQNIRVIR